LRAHDVIVRHIRIRTGVDGQPPLSGWEADAFSTVGAWNVIVDHCTMTWGDRREPLGVGPALHRLDGRRVAPDTSHNVTFSYNLLAEGWRSRATRRASIRRAR
jgi:pectate lyase